MLHRSSPRSASAAASRCRVEAVDQRRAAWCAAGAQQLVARRHLDQDGDVAARGHRHADHRDPDAQHVVARIVEAEAIVLAARLPALELHDQLDPLRRPGRRDAEEILDVDQAEAADLHVMAGQLGTGAEHERLGAAAQLHRVVGDEPVAADDEVERALALADAALADDEHAQAEDVHQHAVDRWCAARADCRGRCRSRAIASGVPLRVRSSGTPRTVGGRRQLRRRRRTPAVTRTHGNVVAIDAGAGSRRASATSSDSR